MLLDVLKPSGFLFDMVLGFLGGNVSLRPAGLDLYGELRGERDWRWRSILGSYDKVDGLIASIHARTEFHDIILHEFSRSRGANVRESVPFIYFNSRLVDFCDLRAACTGIGPAMAFMSGQLSSPRRSFEPALGLARGTGVVLKHYTPSYDEFAKQLTRNYVLFVSRYYRLDDMTRNTPHSLESELLPMEPFILTTPS